MEADMHRAFEMLRHGLAVGLATAAMAAGGCRSGVKIAPNDPGILDASAMSAAREPLGELEFLAGQWRMLDGQELSEEFWSVPHGNSIVGTFRTTDANGALKVQEALAIVAEADGVYLRLRHFDAKMTAREEKVAPVVLKLELAAGRRAVFRCVSGSMSLATITYRREEQTLHSEVVFTPESKREALRFAMRRLGAFPY